MRQRVAIAQAMIMKPKVLLLDEAFSGLDPETRQEMQLLLLELWNTNGMTVIFVTHNLDEAIFMCTRIIGLSQYWTNDDGSRGEGAKIVFDKKVDGASPRPTSWRYQPDFNLLLQGITHDVFSPEHCQRIAEFDLTHADSIPTNEGRKA